MTPIVAAREALGELHRYLSSPEVPWRNCVLTDLVENVIVTMAAIGLTHDGMLEVANVCCHIIAYAYCPEENTKINRARMFDEVDEMWDDFNRCFPL